VRIVVVVSLAASLAVAVAAHARQTPRYLPYSVTLHGTQTTTWSVKGARVWCAQSSQKVTFDGSGQQMLTFDLPSVEATGIAGRGLADLDGTLTVHATRSGTASLRYSAVTDRPASCPSAPTSDVAAAGTCGSSTYKLPVGIRLHGSKPVLLTGTSQSGSGCPWLVGELSDDGDWKPPLGTLTHQDAVNGLLALDASRLRAPGAGRAHGSSSWHLAAPGGALTVSTTTDVTARTSLVATVVPGVSIAGVRFGETYAQLLAQARPYGGLSLPDSGSDMNGITTWQAIGVRIALSYPGASHDQISVDVVAPTRGPHGPGRVVSHPPPADARVSYLTVGSSLEVTAKGIGSGSTLAELKRAGHVRQWVRKGPYGSTIEWYTDGPGRARTAYPLYKNVVQTVQIGCPNRDPVIVVPVDEFGRC
jgi:hypothetical protein